MQEPYPSLDELLTSIGEAGERLDRLGAAEGAAGNISIFLGWPLEVRHDFPRMEEIELPQPAPALAGGLVIVTGSGRRLRDILSDPTRNLGIISIDDGGLTAQLFTSTNALFEHVTSEFNTHLAVHNDYVSRTGGNFQVLVHAQPPHLVYLSHIAAYRDRETLNRRLLRWEPETIIEFPEGIGVLPFLPPGSEELMQSTLICLQEHKLVVWSKHGVIARSGKSIGHAVDLIEYAETAGKYEYMDLGAGGIADGLTRDELRAVADRFNVQTNLV